MRGPREAWVMDAVAKATGATSARRGERIQSLWSGYGEIFRVELTGAGVETVVVKSVQPPARLRGAKKDASHARKCRSYDVETTWYRTLASRCDETCRVPALVGSRTSNGGVAHRARGPGRRGFPGAPRDPGRRRARLVPRWLAAFHARFLGVAPERALEDGDVLAPRDAARRARRHGGPGAPRRRAGARRAAPRVRVPDARSRGREACELCFAQAASRSPPWTSSTWAAAAG